MLQSGQSSRRVSKLFSMPYPSVVLKGMTVLPLKRIKIAFFKCLNIESILNEMVYGLRIFLPLLLIPAIQRIRIFDHSLNLRHFAITKFSIVLKPCICGLLRWMFLGLITENGGRYISVTLSKKKQVQQRSNIFN
jgi:hypothetical protein